MPEKRNTLYRQMAYEIIANLLQYYRYNSMYSKTSLQLGAGNEQFDSL